MKKFAAFAVLCVLSVAAHFAIDKYHEVGEQIILNDDFSSTDFGWQVRSSGEGMAGIDQGVARLESVDDTASPQLIQELDIGKLAATVVLRATVKAENISSGEKSWQGGRILLVQYVDGKPQYRPHHALLSLEGSTDWQEYTTALHILPASSKATVVITLNQVTGRLLCREISLHNVRVNPAYNVVRWAITGGWLIFATVIFVSHLGRYARRGWLVPAITVVAVAGLLIGITLPGDLKNNLKADVIGEVKSYSAAMSVPVIPTIKSIVRKYGINESVIDITKWAHFGLFGVLTFVFLWQSGQPSLVVILVDMLMLACGTELVQLFIDGRGPQLSDVIVDMAGAGTGLLAWLAFGGSRSTRGLSP